MTVSDTSDMIAKGMTAFVFARGGSKGIINKNLREISGCPLIGYAIRSGLDSKYIERVIVSTDSEEIASVARSYGAEVPFMRPESLATDNSSELLAWQHAISTLPEYFKDSEIGSPFISLPATSPLRVSSDVDAAIKKYLDNVKHLDLVVAISESRRNPYLNMVTIKDDGLISVAIQSSKAIRRQDVPQTYDISTAVYVANYEYILNCQRIIDGRVGYIKIPVERSIDIDDKYDLYLAELLMKYPYIKNERVEN